jgi:hypothetical protein
MAEQTERVASCVICGSGEHGGQKDHPYTLAKTEVAQDGVLATHRLSNTRPAMPGPGEAWTCTCGTFQVSPSAQNAHDHHVAMHLASDVGARLDRMAEAANEAELRWLLGEWLTEITALRNPPGVPE